jgi:fumarate hydratase class II
VQHATDGLLVLAMGGTAVGTGLNAPPGFGDQVAAQIARMTGAAYMTAANKFTAQGTLDRMVRAHAGLKAAAVSLFKIANDLRWLGSGPRTGLGELIFPANEPGSSIMPGKVNPTQAEAMLMVAIQVIASDVAVTMGGNEGNFELNAFRPILISNYLHSALIMADMCDHFREFMIEGTKLNQKKLTENIDNSVMMVTALSPVIGYDKAAAISYYAIDHDLTLKQAALAKGVSEELYDRIVIPLNLTRPGTADLPAAPHGS